MYIAKQKVIKQFIEHILFNGKAAFNKIYYEMQKKFGFKAANEWLESEWVGHSYMHDSDTSTFKHYCFAYDLQDLAEKGLFFLGSGFNA